MPTHPLQFNFDSCVHFLLKLQRLDGGEIRQLISWQIGITPILGEEMLVEKE